MRIPRERLAAGVAQPRDDGQDSAPALQIAVDRQEPAPEDLDLAGRHK
jgi:hypothetical protein